MGILLDGCVDRSPLEIFDSKAKYAWIIILFLTPLKMNIQFLQLIEKVINNLNSIYFWLLWLWLQRHYQRVKLLDHEKLLKNRVHVADTSKISNPNESISRLSLFSYFYVGNRIKSTNEFNWVIFCQKFIGQLSIFIRE